MVGQCSASGLQDSGTRTTKSRSAQCRYPCGYRDLKIKRREVYEPFAFVPFTPIYWLNGGPGDNDVYMDYFDVFVASCISIKGYVGRGSVRWSPMFICTEAIPVVAEIRQNCHMRRSADSTRRIYGAHGQTEL
ncbi:hypothetical protein CBL_12535 [Carabus blaptoides fortunei]